MYCVAIAAAEPYELRYSRKGGESKTESSVSDLVKPLELLCLRSEVMSLCHSYDRRTKTQNLIHVYGYRRFSGFGLKHWIVIQPCLNQ